MAGEFNASIDERLRNLETTVAAIKRDVDNHIPTAISRLQTDVTRVADAVTNLDLRLSGKVDGISNRMWWFLGLVPAVAVAVSVILDHLVLR